MNLLTSIPAFANTSRNRRSRQTRSRISSETSSLILTPGITFLSDRLSSELLSPIHLLSPQGIPEAIQPSPTTSLMAIPLTMAAHPTLPSVFTVPSAIGEFTPRVATPDIQDQIALRP